MRRVRILFTCIGGRFALSVIKALRQSKNPKIDIVGADMSPEPVAKYFVDAFYRVPHGSDKNYLSKVISICEREKVEIVIPSADEEVIAVSRGREALLKKGVVCSADKLETLELVTDKLRLFDFLSANGISMPRYKSVYTAKDIKSAAEYLGYPKRRFVIKPMRGRGARDILIVGEDKASVSLKKVISRIKGNNIKRLNSMAMEFLPGEAYDVDLLAKDGRVLCIVPRRRLWKNKLSPSSEGCVIEKNQTLTKFVTGISELLKLNYIYDFDCGSFPDGSPAIYEINPRSSGAVASSLGAGVNIPVMLVRMLKDFRVPVPDLKTGIRMFPVSDMYFLNKGKVFYADKSAE